MAYDRDYGRGDRYRQDQSRWQREGEERGFFDRASDEVRSWFGDEDAERRRRMDEREDDRGRWSGDRDQGRSSYGRGQSYGSKYGMQGSYGRGGSDRGSSYSGQGNYDRDRSSSYGGSSGSYGGGYGRDEQGYGRSNYGASDYGRGSYGQEERGRGGYGGRSSYGDYGTGSGGGAFGYGASQSNTDRGNNDRGWGQSGGRDHDYDRWRNQQIDSLDRDYDEYRRENQSRFDNEFSSWRTTRQSQRQHLDRIEEHMEVVGSDGTTIGKVDKVRGDRVILTKTDDPEGHHHSFSSSWIDTVDTKVKLSKSADEAKKAWKDEDKRTPLSGNAGDYDQGQRTLDRSFSGTY